MAVGRSVFMTCLFVRTRTHARARVCVCGARAHVCMFGCQPTLKRSRPHLLQRYDRDSAFTPRLAPLTLQRRVPEVGVCVCVRARACVCVCVRV